MFNKKGFLFLEGSLFAGIALVGIVSATLFPSMTSYLTRSRDTARFANLKDISTSLGAYYADTESYPPTAVDGCISGAQLDADYMPRGVPTDPTPGRLTTGCKDSTGKATYAYRNITISGSISPSYILSAEFENPTGGNSEKSIDEIVALPDPQQYISTELRKGAGKYYILSN